MNDVVVINNQVAVTRGSTMQLTYVPAAPNGNYGAELSLVTSDTGAVGIYITLTSPLPATIDAAQVVSHGIINGAQASWLYAITDDVLNAMKAGPGTFLIGGGGVVLGSLSGTMPTHVKLVLHNTAGWGVARDTWAYTLVTSVVETLVVTANPTLNAPTVGLPLTGDPPVYTGADNVGYTWRYKTAEDASGLNETDIADTGGICPPITGAQDTLFRGAYFTGAGITGDGVGPGLAGPYWSTGQTIAASPGGTNVTLATDFLVASNRLKLKSVTNATFTPGAVVSQTGGKSATIVAYDNVTSMLFTGPITGGPFTDNVAVTAVGGGAATADGASVPWVIAGGEPYYILQPTFTGVPTSNVFIQEIRDDVGSTVVTVSLAGQMPKHYGDKQYRETHRVSGQGIATTQDFSTAWLDIGVPLLTPLVIPDFKIKVIAEPGGGDRVSDVLIRDSLNVTATRWTTSSDEQIATNPFPAGHEPTTLGATVTEDGIVYRHATTSDAISGSGKNYTVFGPDPEDIDRRTQFRYTAQIGGAWTPLSLPTTVPRVVVIPTTDPDFNRWEFRSQEWAEKGEAGGCGMQFIRNLDSDGDYLHCGIDVTYPMWSDDFGDNLHSDDCIDLFVHQSSVGVVVDGNFVHQMVSAGYNGPKGNYNEKEGIYRKDIAANRWTRTKAIVNVPATNQSFMRTNCRWLCKVPGSGSGPSTRTLYAVCAPEAYPLDEAGFTNLQIYKANANGGASWANDGSAVSVSSTGVPFVLALRSSGGVASGLYLATKSKLMYRDIASGASWAGTGLTGEIRALCVRGNAVFALKKGTGLYKATDNGSGPGAFSLLKGYDAEHAEVAEANANFITIIPRKGDPYLPAIGTQDGGTSWYDVVSIEYPGQPHDFDSHMKGNTVQVHYHKVDPQKVFAFRFQHAGISIDGGKRFNWTGRTFGYSRCHAIAFHPTDMYRMFGTMTDRLAVAFEHGYAFGTDDHITGTGTNSDLDKIDANVGHPDAYAGAGGLVLARGDYTGYIAQVGDGGGSKTPIYFIRGVTNTVANAGASTIAVASTPNVPAGNYVFKCITTGGNGVGKFKVTGPLLSDLGEVTVGTERVITHPTLRGGSITVTISFPGGTANATGQNAKTFTHFVDPLKTETIPTLAQIDNVVSSAMFGQVNPAVPYKGCAGRHRFIMSTTGIISHDGKLGGTNEFQGYMGDTGNVILGSSSDTSLTRSSDGGDTFTAFASGLKGLNAVSRARVAYGSHHDDQRAWCGSNDGRVRKVQAGVVSVAFNFADWVVQKGIVSAANPCEWPGDNSYVSGGQTVWMPPVTGVAESWFNPNLVYCTLYLYGAPYQFFRTKNALAGTPTWENLTDELGIGAPVSGLKGHTFRGPIISLFIHPKTDEPIMCTQHGTIVFRPEQAHRTQYNLPSLVDHLRTLPGADYYATAIP